AGVCREGICTGVQICPASSRRAHKSPPASGASHGSYTRRPATAADEGAPMNARDPHLPLQPDEASALARFAADTWDAQIVPALTDYIAIPAKSPMFDADWQRHGHIERVVRDAAAWVERQRIDGLELEV